VSAIEHITRAGRTLVTIVRAELAPEATLFVTPEDWSQQVGYVVYRAGGEVARHAHRQLERHIVGTGEVIVVRSGRCELDVYDDERTLLATRELRTGDVMIMSGGGHGFRMLEDTVLLEVKQGPYAGEDEKERF
jgi:uncharacterized protein with PhoU and TrkA domain